MKNTTLAIIATALLNILISNVSFATGTGQPENEALASELNFFTIRAINQTSLLSWSSSSSKNYDYFTIERSTDGKTYMEIGKVKSTGSSNFSFIDYKPNNQINYYRFKKVDFDGTMAVSPVRVIIIDKDSPFSIIPTLAKNTLTIQNNNTADLDTDASVQMIFASTGEVMYETKLEANNNKLDINLTTLPQGNYVARIQKANKVYNHLFVKQ